VVLWKRANAKFSGQVSQAILRWTDPLAAEI
jgi:hypothetical protein